MKVSAQYAAEHFDELLSAQDRGEVVEIERENKPVLMLVPKPDAENAVKRPMSELLGSWRGKAWISEDFDSPELNKVIEDEFLNGPFPTERP